jgi:hypothetical protein
MSVQVRPSPTSRGGSSRVEHVNTPVRFSPEIPFRAVKVGLLRTRRRPYVPRLSGKRGCENERPRESLRAGRASGTPRLLFSRILFGGSERAVTSVNALVVRRENLRVQVPLGPASGPMAKHIPFASFSSIPFEGSESAVTSKKHLNRCSGSNQKPAFGFLPRLNFAGSELAVISD